MSMTDPIADLLTRIRNAAAAQHQDVTIPASKLGREIARILREQGYIEDYEVRDPAPGRPGQNLNITLKYTQARKPVITGLQRVSRPGQRTYVDLAGRKYAPLLQHSNLLRMEASFRPAWGTHRRAEMVLMQKVLDRDALAVLLTTDTAPEHKKPGTWMNDALDVRDKWESRLLRTTSWSPWY